MPELLDFSAQSAPLDFTAQSEPLDFSGQSEPIREQVTPQEMAQIEAGQGGVPAGVDVKPTLPPGYDLESYAEPAATPEVQATRNDQFRQNYGLGPSAPRVKQGLFESPFELPRVTSEKAPALAAMVNTAEGAAETALSPGGMAAVILSAGNPLAARAIASAFGVKAVVDLPKSAKNALAVSLDPNATTQQKNEAWMGTGVTAAQAALLPAIAAGAKLPFAEKPLSEKIEHAETASTPPAGDTTIVPPPPTFIHVQTPDGPRKVTISARVDDATGEPRLTFIKLHNEQSGSYEQFPVPPTVRKFASLDEAAQAGFDLVRAKYKEIQELPEKVTPLETQPAGAEGAGAEAQGKAPNLVAGTAEAQTQVTKIAATEGQRSAKEIKEELVTEIQDRLAKAPSETKPGDTVTIDIPGDGKFTVLNNVEALSEMLNRAKRIKTDAGKPTGVPKAAIKSSSAILEKARLAEAEQQAKTEPPQAAVAPTQPGPPESRVGIVPFSSPAASGMFRSLLQGLQTGTGAIGTALRIAAGDTLPRMTKAARPAAEALASFASSNEAAPMQADLFTYRVLADSELSKREYGGYLTEETLRANKAKFLQEAAQAATNGNTKAWQEHLDEAANVKTFIGAHNFPFRTEAQYQAYGARPDVQSVITRNRTLHFNEIEPMHQEASRLAPGTIQQSAVSPNLGFHVSLKGVKAGSSRTAVVAGQAPLGNLRATLRKFNPLSKRRTGAADAYEIDFGEMMRHKFSTELPISLHNRTINEMISGGVAIAGKFDKPPQIGGQPSVPVPLSHGYRFVNEGETTFFKPGENLYVRADLVKEFRNALNTDMALHLPAPFQKAMNLLNSSALMGFADATSHGATLLGQFIQAQTPLLTKLGAPLDMLRRAALDATAAVTRAGERNMEQLSRITLIGAGRAKFPTYRYNPLSVPTHIVHWLDKTYRLMMDDAFTEMAGKGRFEDTPTNRREFINQGLQYNKRLQGLVIRKARELGFSPFVTAARAANMQGLRMSTLAGPVPRNVTARAMLLTNSAATIVGAFTLQAALNYALTKNAGGRAGTGIDQVDLGINDDKGRPIRLGLLSWLGIGRSMRTTGAAAYINAKRSHLPGEVPGEQAMQQAANQQLGQWLGPAPRLAVMAGTGHAPMFGGRRESPAMGPDLNQWLSFNDRPWYNPRGNIPHAVAEANPLLGAYYETHELGRDPKDVLMRQLSKWGPQYGQTDVRQQTLPERVHGARLEDWIDDVVTRSRRYGAHDPMSYALQEADKEKLEGADRKRAIDQFRKRLRGQ